MSPPAEASTPSKSTQRVPAPESPQAIQTRFRVIAAFWAVIIFLGFPIWWQTTSIYRAHLPIQEMVDWADGKVRTPCAIASIPGILTYSPDMSPRLSPRDSSRRAFITVARVSTSTPNYSAYP